jgi:hypothetical protein
VVRQNVRKHDDDEPNRLTALVRLLARLCAHHFLADENRKAADGKIIKEKAPTRD